VKLNEFYETPPVVPNRNPFTLKQMLDKTIHLYEELSRSQQAS
jgi:hypothetical protein